MTTEETRRDPRAKVLSMTVRYKSATVEDFIEHHSHDVSRGGMFIKTPAPFPPGTLLKFEVRLAGDQRVMQGVGRVVWKRDPADASSDAPNGMGVKFIKLDDASRATIERLLSTRTEETSAFEHGQLGASAISPSVPPPDGKVRRGTMEGMGVVGSSVPPEVGSLPPGESFFPAPDPAQEARPLEDQTVMRQAAEVLAGALASAAGTRPDERAGTSGGAERGHEPVVAPSPSAAATSSAAAMPSAAATPSAGATPTTASVENQKAADSSTGVGVTEPRLAAEASAPANAPKSSPDAGSGAKAPTREVPASALASGQRVVPRDGARTGTQGAAAPRRAPAIEPEADSGGGGRIALISLVVLALGAGVYLMTRPAQRDSSGELPSATTASITTSPVPSDVPVASPEPSVAESAEPSVADAAASASASPTAPSATAAPNAATATSQAAPPPVIAPQKPRVKVPKAPVVAAPEVTEPTPPTTATTTGVPLPTSPTATAPTAAPTPVVPAPAAPTAGGTTATAPQPSPAAAPTDNPY